jgi:retinol dehydrogenase-12
VNNAGAMFRRCARTSDGLEMTFALNHLAYFVVTTELLSLLQNTPGARVVNTASSSYRFGRLNLDQVATRKGGGGFRADCDSKLATVIFTRELARRLAPFGGTANCLHPGFTRSRLFEQGSGPFASLARSSLAARFARTPEMAAKDVIWLATSLEASSHTGEYFVNRVSTPISRRALDPALGSQLWALSEELKLQHVP